MTRIGLIADIHGNILALEAVLDDLGRRGVDRILDLGDVAQGSLEPGRVVARLRAAEIPSIRGNTDRLLLESLPSPGFEVDYHYARGQLSADDLEWLARQPTTRLLDDLCACHGSPSSDTTALLETVGPAGARLGTESEIGQRLAGVGPGSLVAVAHSHVPRAVRLADGRLCVNPGSVGLPAYRHHQPFPHVMEAGSPHARYAIVERGRTTWRVEHVAVEYQWDRAADQALAAGRADRAHWLRTGRALE